MAIAIKELKEEDIVAFDNFLKKDRVEIPRLKLASLVYPHEDICVVAYKNNVIDLKKVVHKYQYILTEYGDNIVTISRTIPEYSIDNSRFIFSGYAFYDNKMFIGQQEIINNIVDIRKIKESCGEFSICTIGNGKITLTSDYFGMVPWFYYDDENIFIASNNYHLMLILLVELQVKLTMDIPRSRVNIITSGFTYGTPFTNKMDVKNCKMNLAYEEIHYSFEQGLKLVRTSLWDVISKKYEWNEDLYEEYIWKAKEEIEGNCKAAFENPRFDKVVIDVSGGFDSRVVFAAACNMPKRLRKKIYTYTRKSGTSDDVEKASALTNLYDYPKYSYNKVDTTKLFDISGEINLAHISRTLGTYAVSSYLYSANYDDKKTLEITGYLGEVILGYMRCRGEVDYSLGDRRLLARLGGCYLHNSVEELQEVFKQQEQIINETLNNYSSCDCLFKKFQQLYIDSRNRFICGSSHNIEHNNMRIPMLFSKNALQAKWMYFSLFTNNKVPDEKVSLDLLNVINPIFTTLPFAQNNDNVLPKANNLLNPIRMNCTPNFTYVSGPKVVNASNLYVDKVAEYMDNIDIAEQMLLQIYDYSNEYYPVCLGLYKVLTLLKENPSDIKTGHARETIRKIYDVYYQINIIS